MSSGQARRGGARAGVRRPRPIGPSARSADAYHRAVRDLVLAPVDEVIARTGTLRSAEAVRRELGGALTGATRSEASRIAARVADAGDAATTRLGDAFRRTVKGIGFPRGSRARGDDAARDLLAQWRRENRDLLRSVRVDAEQRMRKIASDPRLRGDVRGMRRALRAERAILNRRIRTITRDQLDTLASRNARVRQTAAGIAEYVWQTVGDDRVRREHVALEGAIRRWSESPRPGEPVNCRCVAIPNLRVDSVPRRRLR